MKENESLPQGSQSFAVFETALGWGGAVSTARGVVRIFLPEPGAAGLRKKIRRDFPRAREKKEVCSGLVSALQSYFKGGRFRWSGSIDWAGITPFSKRVYMAARQIPHGEFRSYQWVGEKAGAARKARAAGGALGRNPLPILIPCHRVVRKNGELGGFSAPGGAARKRKLLDLERAGPVEAGGERKKPLDRKKVRKGFVDR